MQRLAEPVERQRLDVKLDIGGVVVRRRFREHAELRRGHGQRPAAAERVVEAHQPALEERLGVDVEGARALDAEDRTQLQVILQILADAGQGVPQPCASSLDHRGTAETRDLHETRRADRAGREQHFAPRPGGIGLAVPDIGEANGARHVEKDGLRAWAQSTTRRLGRPRIGLRKAVAALQRLPRRWLISK